MATTRVLNISTGLHHKLSQAENWIADGSHAWVDRSKTIRILSLQERVQRRSEIVKQQEGLTYFVQGKDVKLIAKPYFAELPGVIFRNPRCEAQTRLESKLLRITNRFVQAVA